MLLLNQYSFLLLAAVCVLAMGLVLRRRGLHGYEVFALASLVVGFALAFWLLRPGPSSASDPGQLAAEIGSGTPVLLEFQSPFCVGCMAAEPYVRAIERQNQASLVIIRVNAQDPVGQVFAGRYRLGYTPTFVLFDAAGIELWRTVGAVDPQQVRRSLATP